MKRLRHPNLLPLLGSALISVDTASGTRAQVARFCADLLPTAGMPPQFADFYELKWYSVALQASQ